MFRYFLFLQIFLTSNYIFAQIPNVSNGKIKRFENFQSKWVAQRNVDVWLPEGYDAKKKYAVLYMHDGQMLFDSTTTWNKQEWGVDEIAGKLIQENKIKNCIVVGIWNAGKLRHPEYFPQKPFESLTKTQKDTILKAVRSNKQEVFSDYVQSDKYLKFLVTELKPFIDKNFATLKNAKNTFIAGSSMGGLISMYAICEYPKVFGGAGCLSTHWVGTFSTENNPIPAAFMEYLKNNLPNPKNHKLYFDYGTVALDALYPPFQKKADEILKMKGFAAQNWLTKEFVGEDHSENAWRKRLHIPLTFLLGK